MTNTELNKAWELLDDGDAAGVIRHLRFTAEQIPVADLARVVGKAAGLVGFGDLAEAAAELAAEPDDARRLFDFGYACIEHGASYAAIPALVEAVRLAPDSPVARTELVAAYEDELRHSDAVAVLRAAEPALSDWPERYMLAYHLLLAGTPDPARDVFARLAEPDDKWLWARDRLRRMLDRTDTARGVRPLDHQDLRGWQFVLTGAVLAEISPHGFAQGMTGRYAFHQDSHASCRRGLDRLGLVLHAAGRAPTTVSLLDERGAHIMGLAAAEVLGLPAVPYEPDRPDTVVVAYRLDDVDEGTVRSLRERAPGQVLYEHASCWTDPPGVPADVIGLLRQTGSAPWEKQLTADPEGSPPDDRDAAAVAADIVGAPAETDTGDGESPPDPDDAPAAFTAAISAAWAVGPRDRVASAGPVRSSRFV
ncbi:tetratricopeptide repeat protein [Uniformispora flossi]|uniref:tetratricopeptide repeat protein n=1 Tax=Uniformispora flossi TaxID=3390723 RepID=UPI003C2DC3F8